ncbi:hypothetical protein RchiOBHm_Chr2g0090611 [Rosa chinensis]|uniref:Uncharacterized protein n=1 Tax=Rosa chinensis TaxID=74649 RepID=A0A2P6RJJ2_ROSCH|nr:hypothetical protein RchiOBHm_Chr2g0090611 [Rosa chinensis]
MTRSTELIIGEDPDEGPQVAVKGDSCCEEPSAKVQFIVLL